MLCRETAPDIATYVKKAGSRVVINTIYAANRMNLFCKPPNPAVRYARVFGVAMLLLSVTMAGCTRTRLVEEMPDAASLITYLNKEGIATDHTGFVAQPLFSEGGEEYRLIGSDRLHVYEYKHEEAAELDARKIGVRRASLGGAHVYHRGTLIVVYFGRNGNVKITLSNILGPRLV